jgi:hypothetical protein
VTGFPDNSALRIFGLPRMLPDRNQPQPDSVSAELRSP